MTAGAVAGSICVSSDENQDEPSPSSPREASAPARASAAAERMSEPPPTDPLKVGRCPRCGGEARPRARRPTRHNPFLSPAPARPQLTCVDCGLDLELSDCGTPWAKGA
ncbi:MAG: hypothetical protein U0359_03480 [Byssovorax sp.]